MKTRPRHSNKEVRQLADWLDDNGWRFTDLDTKGHSIWTWPASGQTIKLPETPHGTLWVKKTRVEALKIMGQHETTKRKAKPYVAPKPHPGLQITKAHKRQMTQWISDCEQQLCQAARLNGNEQAHTLFRLFARRLREIVEA